METLNNLTNSPNRIALFYLIEAGCFVARRLCAVLLSTTFSVHRCLNMTHPLVRHQAFRIQLLRENVHELIALVSQLTGGNVSLTIP